MSASIVWSGMKNLREALKQLPADLTEEAQQIALQAAEQAHAEIRRVYPVWTGNLVKGVVMRDAKRGRWMAATRVRSNAPHASLFEKGTKPRRAFMRDGKWMKKPANRGFMPAARMFVPIVMRHRRAYMWPMLKRLVERAGFQVYGE